MSEKFDRQTVLDVLKGICIIFVVITHYGWDEKQRLVGLFPYIIDMAVPIFMIISGYVFSNSYLKKGIYHFEDAYDLSIISNRIIRYTIPFLIAYTIELIFFYLGNAIGVAVFILFYIKKKTLLHPHRKYLKMDKLIIKEIMWVGIPHTLEHFFTASAMIVNNNLAAGHGELHVAAMGVANKIKSFGNYIYQGMLAGCQPLMD